MNLTLKVWRQKKATEAGQFVSYQATEVMELLLQLFR